MTSDRVAEILFVKLISGWGLTNAKKIETVLRSKIVEEYQKRRNRGDAPEEKEDEVADTSGCGKGSEN
jgi:hypothetical protein